MGETSPTTDAIRWTQRFVLGALGHDAPRARRISCLVLLAVFVPLGVLSSLAVRAGDFGAPASIAGLLVTTAIFWVVATTKTETQQRRWSCVVLLIGVDQALGIYQLGVHGMVLLPETAMLGVWAALYLPTRIVRHAVIVTAVAISVVVVRSEQRLIATLAVFVAAITVTAVALLVHTAVLTLRATNQQLDDARLLAQRLATTDPLTGAANRRSFTDLVRVLAGQGAEHALLIVDVDNFKLLNDRFGHLVGDEVLRAVARRLAAAVPSGTVARWGGEEFAVLCTPACTHDLGDVAEALRVEVDGDPVITGVGPIACSVSVGATIWARNDNFEQALRRADRALYEAKATGRNRWVQHLRDSVTVDDVRRPA